MEEAHATICELLAELDRAVHTFLTEKRSEFDWRKWNGSVIKLKEHLESVLISSKGRFDADITSVGRMAKQKAIMDSLHQIEQTLDN